MSVFSSAFDYLVILDFEATCDSATRPNPQEIIEFPSVLMSTETLEVVDEFTSFVRPQHYPVLSDYCVDLTSIRQRDVDEAPTFELVFASHHRWLRGSGLRVEGGSDGASFAFVSCGDWDLGTMLPRQCRDSLPPVDAIPWPYQRWINIETPFCEWKSSGGPLGMLAMLDALDLELEGRHHRGIDDCRNLARIAKALLRCGVDFQLTSHVRTAALPPVEVTLVNRGDERRCRLERRTLESILRSASDVFRRRIRSAHDESGQPLNEHRVRRLQAGTRISVYGD